jgi:hypothetical protein
LLNINNGYVTNKIETQIKKDMFRIKEILESYKKDTPKDFLKKIQKQYEFYTNKELFFNLYNKYNLKIGFIRNEFAEIHNLLLEIIHLLKQKKQKDIIQNKF